MTVVGYAQSGTAATASKEDGLNVETATSSNASEEPETATSSDASEEIETATSSNASEEIEHTASSDVSEELETESQEPKAATASNAEAELEEPELTAYTGAAFEETFQEELGESELGGLLKRKSRIATPGEAMAVYELEEEGPSMLVEAGGIGVAVAKNGTNAGGKVAQVDVFASEAVSYTHLEEYNRLPYVKNGYLAVQATSVGMHTASGDGCLLYTSMCSSVKSAWGDASWL